MYRASEMTIWFASGVPLTRFVRPVLAMSWPVLLLIGVLSIFVWPWQNERSAILKDQFESRSDLSRVAPGQFQTSADGERTFFFEGSASDPATGRNVFIVASHGSVEAVTSAKSGAIQSDGDGRFLVLNKGQRNEQNMTFYREGREGGDFETGIQHALARILVAPKFVFRTEEVPAAALRTRSLASAR